MADATTSALVLFAHGARDPQWGEPFEAIRQSVAIRRRDLTVEVAFLELMQPDLAECVAKLVHRGHGTITIAPLFLAQGGHLKQDFPRLVTELGARYPGVRISVLPAIGEVPELLEAIAQWLVAETPRAGR